MRMSWLSFKNALAFCGSVLGNFGMVFLIVPTFVGSGERFDLDLWSLDRCMPWLGTYG